MPPKKSKDRLTESGSVFVQIGWKGNRRFRFKPYLDLFASPHPAEATGKE